MYPITAGPVIETLKAAGDTPMFNLCDLSDRNREEENGT